MLYIIQCIQAKSFPLSETVYEFSTNSLYTGCIKTLMFMLQNID